jgi:hypothetical protein
MATRGNEEFLVGDPEARAPVKARAEDGGRALEDGFGRGASVDASEIGPLTTGPEVEHLTGAFDVRSNPEVSSEVVTAKRGAGNRFMPANALIWGALNR